MLGGRAADVFGRRRVFIIGLTAFTLFSLIGGFAQSGAELIAARAAQGIGGAILAPASLSLLTATFAEHHERRRALGVWSATAASGAAGGLFLGGLLTDLLGWRWVLFVNVPIGIALMAGSLLSLSESTEGLANRRLDLGGAVTVTAGMALVVFGIVSTDSYARSSARTVATLITGAAVLVSFVVIEGRFASDAIIPLRTFRRRTLTLSNVQSTVVGAVVCGCYFFLLLYLQDVKHYSPLRAGLAFLPIGLMAFGGALAASRLVWPSWPPSRPSDPSRSWARCTAPCGPDPGLHARLSGHSRSLSSGRVCGVPLEPARPARAQAGRLPAKASSSR